MGNTLGGKKIIKVMNVSGETMKFKSPIQARDVVKDYPGHVVLDSQTVKHYGIRAKPLDPFHSLEPKKLYFMVELPKFPNMNEHQHRVPRRARSGINMSAKDRLENLMLAKRSVSDLSLMGPATRVEVDETHDGVESGSMLRVRMRLPKSEVEKLMRQSKDSNEAAGKIMDICVGKSSGELSNVDENGSNNRSNRKGKMIEDGAASVGRSNLVNKSFAQKERPTGYKKRVGFMPIHETELGVAVAS